ncbi:hypothetical protein [Cupriavidus sp. L7L]|uniref:hypothetical protein n=1 Tax=Cupriavidus sp. L7L TaxID=2546443 RepID=UPI0014054ED6|nr:hypothetical protein [Cupriavidus sp. L7L]
MFKAQCIAYDHLQPDIESVAVELHDLVGAHGRPTFRLIVRALCRQSKAAFSLFNLLHTGRVHAEELRTDEKAIRRWQDGCS